MESLATLTGTLFFGAAALFAVAECLSPARAPTSPIGRRWLTNLALFFFGFLIHRMLLPFTALIAAQAAGELGSGLFQKLSLQAAIAVPLGVLFLDFWKYIEHRLFHGVPLLWRLHRVHHSDVDVDFTTTERHHPLEVCVSMLFLPSAVFILGVPDLAVGVYVLLGSIVALFSHSNVELGPAFNRRLSWLIVTPRVHCIHHSADPPETNSNYGILLTLWDRVFKTFRQEVAKSRGRQRLGLEYFRDARSARLDRVLLQPFLPAPTEQRPAAGQGALERGGQAENLETWG
ncbi:sterol desaturase family protein [Pelagibius marinus]|uniref:sterol desaturase family protein n=1 Tax=Pelagibius marinus TaxID=2762760 RepID=UPI00187264E9|nr:sterol desaturase family protein [Pelagibius marinus]